MPKGPKGQKHPADVIRRFALHQRWLLGSRSAFADLPDYVRHQGLWQRREPKLECRTALARDGYALVKCELAVVMPEV
jgi:hypothetical protein